MIDVIVATYNRPQWLDECLRSILVAASQVPEPIGIIVVDDASATLGTREVAKRHGVRYIRHEANTGVAQTLADGWAASDAKWTTFWGDDDVMLPHYFARHLEHMQDADVISSSYNIVGPDLEFRQSYILAPVTLHDLMADRVSANDGSLLRRSAVPRLRPERERAMMLTLWLEMARAGARFATISEPCWLYRRHEHNLSGSMPLQAEPRFAQLRREAIAEYA